MGYIEELKLRMSQVGIPKSVPVDDTEKPLEEIKPQVKPSPEKSGEGLTGSLNGSEAKAEEVLPQEKEIIEVPGILIPPKDDDKQFYLSQTIIKAITNANGDYKEVCPQAIYQKYILKSVAYTSDPMMEGIYGESLCLGGGAKGQYLDDLPRHKRTGEKKTAQLNIEEQARRFPIWCNEYGIAIHPGVNTQVPIIKRWGDNGKRFIRTEIDIFPTPFIHEDQLRMAVMDLKFTADIDSRFGPKSNMEVNAVASGGWGAPEYIDHCQADTTYWLLRDFDMELNIKHNPEKEAVYRSVFENATIQRMIKNEDLMFVYFVVGYKKQPLEEQKKFYHRKYRDDNGSDYRQRELQERIRKTYAQLNEWAQQGWPASPGSLCDRCPVNKKNGGPCLLAPKVRSI